MDAMKQALVQSFNEKNKFSQGFGNVLEPSQSFKSLGESSNDEHKNPPRYYMLPHSFFSFSKRSGDVNPDMDVFTATRG